MTTLSTIVCALAAFARSPAASDGWTTLELPGLCRESRAVREPRRLDLGSHLFTSGEQVEREAREPSVLPVSTLLGWLEDETRRRKLTARFHPSAPPLLVRGDDATLAGIRALVGELERADAARTVELRAWLIDGVLELATTRPDRAAVAKIAGAREPWAACSVRSGEPAMLGERALQSYVASYSVEVASDSGVADPEVGSIVTGRTLHVRACRLRNGSAVHLEGLLDVAALVSLNAYPTGTPDLGQIQVPAVDVLQVAFAGAVDSGGALAVVVRRGDAGATSLTLLLEARTTPDAESASSVRGIDLAWVETHSTALPWPLPGYGCDVPRQPERTVLREGLGAASVALLVDESSRSSSRSQRSPALFFPGFLLAPREDTAWAELEPLVAACERDAFEQADVSLEHGPLRVLAPATLGFPWRVLAGVERTLLVDYDVQVAPQSWMPSPQVEHVLDGVLAQGYLAGAGLACDAWVASSREPRDLERKDIGVGRMQTLQRTASVGDGIVRRGAPRLALVPASANAPALSVQMRP